MTSRDMEWHINKRGLSNKLLGEFMSTLSDPTFKKRFLSVFQWTEIPDVKVINAVKKQEKTDDTNISFIVNVGNHFVSVIITAVSILYICRTAINSSISNSLFTREKTRDKVSIRSFKPYFF